MKRRILFAALLIAAILSLACARDRASDTAITVTLPDGEHYSVEVGSVTAEPGENVTLYIQTESGYSVTATDSRGEYSLSLSHGRTKLELHSVQYPTRVALTLSHSFRTIHYHANGGTALTGQGLTVTEQYDIRTHTRPNVSIGTDLFKRDGYTLIDWNTEADGSGQSVGLGSRMTVDDTADLYAQWAAWTDAERFACRLSDGCAVITGYTGTDATLVVPETLGGAAVTGIDALAFQGCSAETVILPKSLVRIEKNAFDGAALSTLYFYDNIEYITDECFAHCENLATLHISAIEDPYGYSFRRESVFADKMDLLINTMGQDRLIFYGGCAMWYNLIGSDAVATFGSQYTVINMGLNGVASSLFQMELIRCFVTERDILFHTPEISSEQQLMTYTALSIHDGKIWCALEYNYDLVSLIDIRVFDGGVFESLRLYLDKKKPGGTYSDVYRDSEGHSFWDETGSLPFLREKSKASLTDDVELDPKYLADLSRLEAEYRLFMERGVTIYVSFACIDIDDVPAEQRQNLNLMGERFLEVFSAMDGVTVFGDIRDFVFHNTDCYDTVYHLLTAPARYCTRMWIRDLKAQLIADGRWRETA